LKIIEYIKREWRERILAKMAAIPHKKRLPHLDHVHSIAIVLPHESTDEERTILQFFDSHMAKRDIVVTHYRVPAADDKVNLTRLGFPSPEHLATFASRSYDMVIAATQADDARALYAVLSAAASLRVAYDDTTLLLPSLAVRTYDLFIRAKGPCDLTNYLREILILLLKIEN